MISYQSLLLSTIVLNDKIKYVFQYCYSDIFSCDIYIYIYILQYVKGMLYVNMPYVPP